MDSSPEATHVEGEEWVAVARLTRTWGRRGELLAIPLTSHPERFSLLKRVTLRGGEAFPEGERQLRVERVWAHQGRYVFKFEGIDTIGQAEELKGATVCVPASERFRLPEGEYYISDLLHCTVVGPEGQPLGRVVDFIEQADSGVLVVEGQQQEELLIPFHEPICVEVDLEKRRIVVELPAGLKELNRE